MFLQEYARTKDQLTHFLTYADNNAVGYFAKQGFTTEITMPREQVSQAVQPGSLYKGTAPLQCVQCWLPSGLASCCLWQCRYMALGPGQAASSHAKTMCVISPARHAAVTHSRLAEAGASLMKCVHGPGRCAAAL